MQRSYETNQQYCCRCISPVQLPAGLVDAGESAAQAAVRELLEETGAPAAGSRPRSSLAACSVGRPSGLLLNMHLAACHPARHWGLKVPPRAPAPLRRVHWQGGGCDPHLC
jgi:8-oxo-dGTP pyrophosphatase MutT (NUDIX family)